MVATTACDSVGGTRLGQDKGRTRFEWAFGRGWCDLSSATTARPAGHGRRELPCFLRTPAVLVSRPLVASAVSSALSSVSLLDLRTPARRGLLSSLSRVFRAHHPPAAAPPTANHIGSARPAPDVVPSASHPAPAPGHPTTEITQRLSPSLLQTTQTTVETTDLASPRVHSLQALIALTTPYDRTPTARERRPRSLHTPHKPHDSQ